MMTWNSAGEFFAMGGYGLYVWGSVGVVALCMGVETWLLARRSGFARAAAAPEEAQPAVTQHSTHGVEDEITA